MEFHNFSKIEDFRELGHKRIRQYAKLDQYFIVKAEVDLAKCTGCQRCFISCRDSGYQAFEIINHLPVLDNDKCVGCSLCSHVCPNNAIQMVEVH